MKRSCTYLKQICTLLLIFSSLSAAKAQNFGQNKVRYKNEDFQVLQTPHFEIYYYLKNQRFMQKFAQDAEIWYQMHQQVFRDSFLKKNPIILYNNQPDFQQTT